MKTIRASSAGAAMRCEAYLRISNGGVDSSHDASNFGRAFAKAQERSRKGEQTDYVALQAEFMLTDEELKELQRCQWRITCDFSEWNLLAESKLACDEYMQPVPFGSPKAFISGHPDVVAFNRPHPNMAQVRDDKTTRAEQLDSIQLLLYVVLVLANFHEVDTVDAVYDYNRLGYSVRRKDKDGNPQPYTREEITTKVWPHLVEKLKAAKKWRITNQSGFTIGAQCARCNPCACPAWNRYRPLLTTAQNIAGLLRPEATAAEKAAFVVDWLPVVRVIKAAAAELDELLKNIGQEQSISLGDGTSWCNRPSTVTKIDAKIGLPFLLDKLNGDAASLGEVLGHLSKSDVAAVIRRLVDTKQIAGKKGALTDEALLLLKEKNAMMFDTRNRVSVYSDGEELTEESER